MKETPNWDKEVIKYHARCIQFETQEIERMRRCACHQCLLSAELLEEQHEREKWQILNPPSLDHEEELVMKYALGKVEND